MLDIRKIKCLGVVCIFAIEELSVQVFAEELSVQVRYIVIVIAVGQIKIWL